MQSTNNNLLVNDRIIKINDFNLVQNTDYGANRRNVVCYSLKLEKYTEENNLTVVKFHNLMLTNHKKFKELISDAKVIKVIGYY